MSTYDPPLWMQALTYPAGVDRDLIDATFPTGGVISPGDLAVAQRAAGANMTVDVAAGKVVIAGTDMAGQGKYLGKVLSTVNVPIGAAPAGGLTRVDLVHAHITDATVVGGSTNSLAVAVAAGTAVSSNPQPPAVPASSEALANITVASGTAAITSAMIADRRRHVPPGPYLSAGQGPFSTDMFGNWSVTLPAGAKLVAATANGSQQDVAVIMAMNLIGGPIGGNTVMFRTWFPNGTNPANTTVGATWLAAWTY